MATYRHAIPGSILASKRLIVSDALTSSSTTKFTIEQPKNSIVDAVIVRALDALEIASGNIGCKVGITDGTDAVVAAGSNNNILSSGTDVAVGSAYNLTVAAAHKFNGPTGSVTTDERDLHFTVTSSTDVASGGNGRLEFTVVYRIFD